MLEKMATGGQDQMSPAETAKAQNDSEKNQIAAQKVGVDAMKAETGHIVAQADFIRAEREAAFAGFHGNTPF